MTLLATAAARRPAYDVAQVRRDFPILATRMNDRPLVYLDTAASAQKPAVVIDALKHFYEHDYANIHRGVYDLSQRATAADDAARAQGAALPQCAPTGARSCSPATPPRRINLVAASFLRPSCSRRRDPGHRDGAPRQHRALADWRREPPAPRSWRHRSPTRAS